MNGRTPEEVFRTGLPKPSTSTRKEKPTPLDFTPPQGQLSGQHHHCTCCCSGVHALYCSRLSQLTVSPDVDLLYDLRTNSAPVLSPHACIHRAHFLYFLQNPPPALYWADTLHDHTNFFPARAGRPCPPVASKWM